MHSTDKTDSRFLEYYIFWISISPRMTLNSISDVKFNQSPYDVKYDVKLAQWFPRPVDTPSVKWQIEIDNSQYRSDCQ